MSETVQSLGLNLRLKTNFAEAQSLITEALKAQGFGILTEIDVQTTFKNKLNQDFRPYKILGACNPQLAYRSLSANAEVGLLLPCNITLSEESTGEVLVSIVDPMTMLTIVEHPELAEVAAEAKSRLSQALASLSV